ncbi:MAG: methyltransferase domain-containing protein, partial [Chthoniobacterales bacterium]
MAEWTKYAKAKATNNLNMSFSDQSRFEECYRGRQSLLHHMAYMRMAKVLVVLQVLKEFEVSLSGKAIFDYGFGAGTLFRYCPKDAFLYGVEQDALNVASVKKMLTERGYSHLDLQSLEISSWETHPLLARKYDVIICSHVLEHMTHPAEFLLRILQCLEPNGIFLGLVPVNERVMNKHHTVKLNRQIIKEWMNRPELQMAYYEEFDPLMYWFQPLFNHDTGIYHKMAQGLS